MRYSKFPLPNQDQRCTYCKSKNKQIIKYTRVGYPQKTVITLRCCDCGKVDYFTSTIDETPVSILMSPYDCEVICCSHLCNHPCEYKPHYNHERKAPPIDPSRAGSEFSYERKPSKFIPTSDQPLINTSTGPLPNYPYGI